VNRPLEGTKAIIFGLTDITGPLNGVRRRWLRDQVRSRLYQGRALAMANTYSYKVLKDHDWAWELVSPSGVIVGHGIAKTQAAARAVAMSCWLELMISESGDSGVK
jgi:hypothetical protein